MKKIIGIIQEAVIGSLLFTGLVTAVAIAFVSLFRH